VVMLEFAVAFKVRTDWLVLDACWTAQVEGFQPLTNDGKPLTMTRRDDGTYEVDVVEEK
jgi:hypothetical protein